MSFTFTSSVTGEEVGRAPFPGDVRVSTLHWMLGQGAYLLLFIQGTEIVKVDRTFRGSTCLQILAQPLNFDVYFHDEQGGGGPRLVHTLAVDVLDLLGTPSTNQLIADSVARKHFKVRFGRLWGAWLKSSMERGGVAGLTRLVAFVEADIMVSHQVRRRNVLHELTNPGRVDLYFVFKADRNLCLRLVRPMHGVARPEVEPMAVLFEYEV